MPQSGLTATLRHGTLRRRGTPGLPPQAARVVPFPVTRVTRRLSRVRTICWTFVGERGRTAHNAGRGRRPRSEEHTSELQSLTNLVCRLLLEKKKENGRRQRPEMSAVIERKSTRP